MNRITRGAADKTMPGAADRFFQLEEIEHLAAPLGDHGARDVKQRRIDICIVSQGLDHAGEHGVGDRHANRNQGGAIDDKTGRDALLQIMALEGAQPPGQTREFRLPFEGLPESWNQALPTLVIANISFAG